MNRQEWIEKAKRDTDKLQSLIGKYHPQRRSPMTKRQLDMVGETMTAPNAELACESIRNQIRQQYRDENLQDPVQIFTKALEAGNILVAYKVLDQTWFGVPETTSCWTFTGFTESVELIEDAMEILEEERVSTSDGDDLHNGDSERDLGYHGPE